MGKEKKVSWEDIAEHTTEEKKASTAIGPEHCHRPMASRVLTDSYHDRCSQVWLAISGIAYDVTEFLAEHPGGEEVVMEVTGAGCCSRSPARLRRASRLRWPQGRTRRLTSKTWAIRMRRAA